MGGQEHQSEEDSGSIQRIFTLTFQVRHRHYVGWLLVPYFLHLTMINFCNRGGQWNSGGKCHRETEPIFNQIYLAEYPEKMVILEQVLRQMKTPVIYLNISSLTDYRKDGHPSVYRVRYDTEEERMAMVKRQDCSHWCLPGVPDTWNELLYASLLQAGKGSWKLWEDGSIHMPKQRQSITDDSWSSGLWL